MPNLFSYFSRAASVAPPASAPSTQKGPEPMAPIAIFQLVLEILTEAPALIADVTALVNSIKGFTAANPNPTPEHIAAIKTVAKAVS